MSISSYELAVSLGSVTTIRRAPRVGRGGEIPRDEHRIALRRSGQAVGTVDGVPRTRTAPFTREAWLAMGANAAQRLNRAMAFIFMSDIVRYDVVAPRR
mmetsp:Transcript_11457/g.53258  ORF Transcript_11457/g.53258 Transcript_11457/m.53258 type:complete len:99 (-) Transcript_11457:34-330(-)